jgi:hypothetical protein
MSLLYSAACLQLTLSTAASNGCGNEGWLFGRDIKPSEEIISDEEFRMLSTPMSAPQPPPKDQPLRRELYLSTLCSVLRTTPPKEQKSFGRKCRNFDPAIWDSASVPVAVACSVARAEADYVLKQIYLKAGKRTFVEGSPQDTI